MYIAQMLLRNSLTAVVQFNITACQSWHILCPEVTVRF